MKHQKEDIKRYIQVRKKNNIRNILSIIAIILVLIVGAYKCNHDYKKSQNIGTCYYEIYKKHIDKPHNYEIRMISKIHNLSLHLFSQKINKKRNRNNDTLVLFHLSNPQDLNKKRRFDYVYDTFTVTKIPISMEDSKRLKYLIISNISLFNIEKFSICCKYSDYNGIKIQISIDDNASTPFTFTSSYVSSLKYIFPDIYSYIDTLRLKHPKLDSILKDVQY